MFSFDVPSAIADSEKYHWPNSVAGHLRSVCRLIGLEADNRFA